MEDIKETKNDNRYRRCNKCKNNFQWEEKLVLNLNIDDEHHEPITLSPPPLDICHLCLEANYNNSYFLDECYWCDLFRELPIHGGFDPARMLNQNSGPTRICKEEYENHNRIEGVKLNLL